MSDRGRPAHFETPELMQQAIDLYFKTCDAEKKKPTITRLAYALGFESRQSFYDYEEREQFSYIVKRARLLVEAGYEDGLRESNPTGSIFALKNMGWRDKVETGFTDNQGNDVETVVYRIPDNGRYKKEEDTAAAAGVSGESTEQPG